MGATGDSQPQSFSVPEVRLLIVLLPGFGCGVCLLSGRSCGVARCARVRTGSDRAGVVSFRVAGVVGAGQAGAGRAQSRCQQVRNASFHGQSGADLEDALPGVAGQPGGQVPDPVAERVRVGVAEVRRRAGPRRRVQAVRSAAMFAARTQPC